MREILYFVRTHKYFTITILLIDLILAYLIIKKTYVYVNRHIYEALGGRGERLSLYGKCISAVRGMVGRYERRGRKYGLYLRMSDKLKKSGYGDEKAAMIYFVLKYLLLPILFTASYIINYPDIIKPVTATLLVFVIIELVI